MAKLMPFILLVVGYIAFEMYAVHRTKYRIDPIYIFDQFVLADHAVKKCGNPDAEQLEQFLRNLESVTTRASTKLQERHPDRSAEAIDRMIDTRVKEHEKEVMVIVEAHGCDDPQIKTLLKRFEIRARLKVG